MVAVAALAPSSAKIRARAWLRNRGVPGAPKRDEIDTLRAST
jgi:hypothetical protein